MKPLKVLMTTDTVGGVWTYTLELIDALHGCPCEILLATMGAPLSATQARALCHFRHLQVLESGYKLEWMEEPWADVDAAGTWLLEAAATFQPDLVHLNNYAYGALPWPAPVLMVGHSCVYSWWQAVKGEAPPPRWQGYQQRVRAGLRGADLVVAPTKAMLAALQLYYGPLPSTLVIHNGRNPHHFAPGSKEDFIFAIGRLWDEAKNVQVLDDIAHKVGWPIYVAGEDQHPDGGRLAFQQLRALGKLTPNEEAHWLAQAAIYAFPARYEPFGLSILEAALSGCALVLGDLPSLRELWDEAALFLPAHDSAAWAHTLRTLRQQPDRRRMLGRAARLRAQQYTNTAMGAAYWQLYRQLVTPVAKPQPAAGQLETTLASLRLPQVLPTG